MAIALLLFPFPPFVAVCNKCSTTAIITFHAGPRIRPPKPANPLKKNKLLLLFLPLFAAGAFLRVQTAGLPVVFQYDPYLELAAETRAHYAGLLSACGSAARCAREAGKFSYPEFQRTAAAGLKWTPPLHNLVVGALMAAASDPVGAAQLWSLFCNFLSLGLLLLLLRHYFGGDRAPVLLGLNLALFLPAHIYLSNFASPDVTYAALCGAFLLAAVRTELGGRSWSTVTLLSLLCALLLLTRFAGPACFVFLNAVILLNFLKKRFSLPVLAGYLAIAWVTAAALAGWLYLPRLLSPDGVLMPWLSGANEHNFYTFNFFSLLAGPVNNWHESGSVLTGLYASFFSFDRIHAAVQLPGLRNALFWLALPLAPVTLEGLASSLRDRRYDTLNIFTLIMAAGTAWTYYQVALPHGMLKASYLMFCLPAGAVYFGEGCRLVLARGRAALPALAAYAAGLDLLVVVYYYSFDFTKWW